MPWLIFASPTKKRDVFYFYCQVIWVALASCTFCLPNKMAIQDIIRTISQSWFNLDLCFIANLIRIVLFSWLSKATIIKLPNFRRSFNIWRFNAPTESRLVLFLRHSVIVWTKKKEIQNFEFLWPLLLQRYGWCTFRAQSAQLSEYFARLSQFPNDIWSEYLKL